MKKITLFLSLFCGINFFFFSQNNIYAQKIPNVNPASPLLESGPMLGYSTMMEVMVWVQTTQSAKVHIVYYDQKNPKERITSSKIQTQTDKFFIAHIIAGVKPDKKYDYELYINDKQIKFPYPLQFQSQTLWRWRTDPPTIKFALGSCNYVNDSIYDRPGKPYGDKHEIFYSIAKEKPDFMLWLGDNTYLRESDYDSRTGIFYRHTHTRKLPEMQALLASTHNYATWDDHDFGHNNSDRSYALKDITLEAFKLFWGNQNYGIAGGVSGSFVWGDVEFFVLDDRYFRTPSDYQGVDAIMFGEKQLTWVLDALKASQATFKFVMCGGQMMNNAHLPWLENFVKCGNEYNRFFTTLDKEKIPGVILLTGDRHNSELNKMERGGSYPIYELTCSPLTASGVGDRAKEEKNGFRVPDTYYGERNYATCTITGTRKERVLTIQLFDVQGKEIWKKEIKEQELK
jgi:alkaline phosphatase D